MYGLKIHLLSFLIDTNIVKADDQIRFSITSIPDDCKEVYNMEIKNLSGSHHFFSVNISDQTKKILFVIRKKNFIKNDPIIASTFINACELPSPDNNKNSFIQSIKLYEPIQQKNKNVDIFNRKVLGQMEMKFTITKPEFQFKNSSNVEKIYKGQGYSKVKTQSLLIDEN